jgi:hypothetical protein
MELAKARLAFDPGVAELDHPAAAAILRMSLGRRHLPPELRSPGAPTMRITRGALRLERTALTILHPGLVAVEEVFRLAFCAVLLEPLLLRVGNGSLTIRRLARFWTSPLRTSTKPAVGEQITAITSMFSVSYL